MPPTDPLIPQWLQYGAAGVLLALGLDMWRLWRIQLSGLHARWARQEDAEDAVRVQIVQELAGLRASLAEVRAELAALRREIAP